MNIALKAVSGAAALLFSVAASAAFLVNTGPGTDSTGGVIASGESNPLGSGFYQNLAARFSLSNDATIGSIQGWLSKSTSSPDDSTLTASIYSNASNAPGAQLFSQSFSLGTVETTAMWMGPTGLNWSLSAGSYWVVFGGLPGQTGIASFAAGVANPLSSYKWQAPTFSGTFWNPLNAVYHWGVQISEVSAVPEVPTPLLLGSGVLALGAAFQRRARRL